MSMQKKLDERDFRYLQFVVGRAHGTTDEQIVKELEEPDIESPQVLYRDVHPGDWLALETFSYSLSPTLSE
jgi:hypothetical protein